MKYLLAQPANVKFMWELDVVLTNIFSLDSQAKVLLLFLEQNFDAAGYIQGRYPQTEVYQYKDTRTKKNYLPAIRPYLCWRHWSAHPEAAAEAYFQIDSDIIFRQLPNWDKMPLEGKRCWASDCNGYIGYNYLISRKHGDEIVSKFAEIVKIPSVDIYATPGAGAQWLINQPTAQLWYHMWQDSDLLYEYLQTVDSDIQKWTAEMWAELYNLVKFGWQICLSDELSFCRPTDPIEQWDSVNILHNAGVLAEQSRQLFFKGEYLFEMPFKKHLNFVDPKKASKRYVEAIQKVSF